MAINRNIPATVIVGGYVDRITEQLTSAEKGRRLYAHDLVLQTESGGNLAARIWVREGEEALPVPSVGEYVAYVASVSERRDQKGTLHAELHVRRIITPGDVDQLHSFVGALATA